ncbi:MAG: CCA tRNA nucleotidyltransferase [Clostridia bacterium]|nr:CCA tRNA nucleotidyltransferase [Clostridia bacterium]
MNISIPTPVLCALDTLNAAGYEAYIVGGCVRDALMGRTPADWDITTSARPQQTAAVFHEYHTIETGVKYGTLTVIVDDMPLEITTYRVDGDYTDSRRPDEVQYTVQLVEDLRRRDFTVNAIAYHPTVGFIDPFDGQNDILQHTIRCVGDPVQRLTEDSLRIARAVRFAATLGFTIDSETASALHTLAATVRHSAVERIAVELKKLLCGMNVRYVFNEFRDVLSAMVPELEVSLLNADLLEKVEPTPLLRLAALFIGLDKTPQEAAATAVNALKQLRLDNETIYGVERLVLFRDYPLAANERCILRLLNRLGPRLATDLIHIRSAFERDLDHDSVLSDLNRLAYSGRYRIQDLKISGNDLLDLGFTPGPYLGETLQRLLEAVMDGLCPNEREALLKLAGERKI